MPSSIKRINQPVYSFLGYFLTKAAFSQTKYGERLIDKIEIKTSDFQKEEEKIGFHVDISITGESFTSSFTFTTQYEINDEKWYDYFKDDQKELISILFSSAFPFIRQAIFSLTNDSCEGLMIPTIDLRDVDLSGGIIIARKQV
jgi:hypothetical protein